MDKERLESLKKRADRAVALAEEITKVQNAQFSSESKNLSVSTQSTIYAWGRAEWLKQMEAQLERLLSDTDETSDPDASGNGHSDNSVRAKEPEPKLVQPAIGG